MYQCCGSVTFCTDPKICTTDLLIKILVFFVSNLHDAKNKKIVLAYYF
jgi:hypothetical protein